MRSADRPGVQRAARPRRVRAPPRPGCRRASGPSRTEGSSRTGRSSRRLTALGVPPADAAMVGDSYADDIEGRARSGCTRSSSTAMVSTSTSLTGSTRPGAAGGVGLDLVAGHHARPVAARHASVCAPRETSAGARATGRGRRAPRRVRQPGRRTPPRRRRARATPRAGARRTRPQLLSERLLVGRVLPRRELGALDELAEPREEHRLERPDGQVPAVGRLVDGVARETAREQARHGVSGARCATRSWAPWVIETTTCAPSPVRSRASKAARIALTAPSAPAARSAICTGGRRGPCRQDACPAEVVEVVTDPQRMPTVEAEAGDRAIDDRAGHVLPARCRAGSRHRAGTPRSRRPPVSTTPGRTPGRASGRRRPTPFPA